MTLLTIHEAAENPEVRAHVARQTVNQRVAAEWKRFCAVPEIAGEVNEYSWKKTNLRMCEERIRDLKNEIYFESHSDAIERLSEELQEEMRNKEELESRMEAVESQIVINAREAGFSEVSKLRILAPWRNL